MIILFLILFVSTALMSEECVLPYNNKCLDKTSLPKTTATVLLEDFLDVEGPFNSLLNYQRSSMAPMKHFKAAPGKNDIKLTLFYAMRVYYSSVHDASANEHLNSSFKGFFLKNEDRILDVLSRVPLLIEPVCYYLSNHFGFENVPLSERAKFWKTHRKKIISIAQTKLTRCEEYMDSKTRLESPYLGK